MAVKKTSDIGSLLQGGSSSVGQTIQPASTAASYAIQPASTQSTNFLSKPSTTTGNIPVYSAPLNQPTLTGVSKTPLGPTLQIVSTPKPPPAQTQAQSDFLSLSKSLPYGTPGSSGDVPYYLTPNYIASKATPTTISSQSGGNLLSRAYDAVKGFLNKPLTGDASQTASFLSAVPTNIASSSPTTSATTASTTAPVTQTTPTTSQAKTLSEQYKVISQDKTSDSATIRKNIDTLRTQEQSGIETQLQQLYKQLSDAQTKLAAAQAQEQLPATTDQAAQPPTQNFAESYAPDNVPGISNLSSQIQSIQDEIARIQQGSPEYQEAEKAYNEKVAEEQAIKARLNEGQTNIAEQPVAYSFISGQQAALERRANADLQTNAAQRVPLQMKVAAEQAKKQAALDVAKTRLGAAEGERARLEDTYKTNYNRATTLADRAAERAFNNMTRLTEVSPGATLYNPYSNTAVYTAPSKTTTGTTVNTSGSTTGMNSSKVTQLKNALNASKFAGPEADGQYSDPSLYLANYQSWLASGGSADEFFRNFPPSTYINPANTWLPQEIMQFVKKPGSSVPSSNQITNPYRT